MLKYFVSFRKGEDNAAFLKLSGPQHILFTGFFFFGKTLHQVGNILWVSVFYIPLTHRLVHNEFV